MPLQMNAHGPSSVCCPVALIRAGTTAGSLRLPADAHQAHRNLEKPATATMTLLSWHGAARRQVGELLAVRNQAGLYYTAPVTSITRNFQAGAYSPLLTEGGLLVVDDVASVSFGAGSTVSLTGGQPFLYSWFRNTPVWQLYQASAGCGGATACTCMDDAPTSDKSPLGCVRRNQALRERGLANSWWHTEASAVSVWPTGGRGLAAHTHPWLVGGTYRVQAQHSGLPLRGCCVGLHRCPHMQGSAVPC